ncbi:transglutaminase family protein [Belnapia sp. T18]|uniref:Transglutaminase family protein n=1 Tax=Belnapia arida TaxID=2804533 RepID=A0ABS1UCQ6_9PROT|nr:transglutaminase family protein [Belnapia arida]MBL6082439.1 transglutaminase family protein [Belnapia arida]
MQIRIGYELTYDLPGPVEGVFLLNVHPSRTPDLMTPDAVVVTPYLPVRFYNDSFGNICQRLSLPAGRVTLGANAIINDSGLPDIACPDARQVPLIEVPNDALIFLLASRYCDTELLSDIAWRTFGHGLSGWSLVQAICDFVHHRIRFNYQNARNTRTALEAYNEQTGVCRDFTHLAVALCRCMNIPARYCTGYLGDIGVPPVPDPMDWSAWFEVYLEGGWYTFDARHNRPRIGRVLMARGRDAADVAISTTFGPSTLVGFRVDTEERSG